MKKLAIVSTHPIQYNAPWFKLLAERGKVELKVFYTWSQSKTTVKDKVFGKDIQWDIPLLEGYNYEFVENDSKKPGSQHFFGIDCPDLVMRITDFKPDIILVFGWNFKSHFKVIRHFHGKTPVWFRGDSTLLDETGGFKIKLRRFILTMIYRYVDKAFYVGEANKAYFSKHGLKQHQLVYAPHAIDNKRFGSDVLQKYEKEALLWRSELGYKADDIVILFAGKFELKKQPDFLLESVQEYNTQSLKKIKLIFLGSGPMEKLLKEQADNDPHIIFLPFQNQSMMPLVYRLADVFCLPSKGPGETWGLAVNEAMACGRPVIISDKVGCAQDLVSQNNIGFIFKHDSLEELTAILVNLSKSSLHQMGEIAKEKIKDYSFLDVVKAIEGELRNFI